MASKARSTESTTNTNQVEATNLFGQLYNDSKETLKQQGYALSERSLQRKLQSAYDSGLELIDNLRLYISKERAQLSNMNINTINGYYAQIENAQKALEYTAQEYKTLFGTEISK